MAQHIFGRTRPSALGYSVSSTPKRNVSYRELPPPTGSDPFHLDLASILPEEHYLDVLHKSF